MLFLDSYEEVADFLFFYFFQCCFNVVVTIGAFSVYTSDSQQEVTEGVLVHLLCGISCGIILIVYFSLQ